MAAGDQWYGTITANTSSTTFSRTFLSPTFNNHTRDGVLWEFSIYDNASPSITYTITGTGNAIDGYGGYLINGFARLYDSQNCLISDNGTMTFTWGGGGTTGFFSFPGAGIFEIPQAFAGSTGAGNVGFTEE